MIRTYSGTPELTWYLQHPLEAFRTVVFELSHSPVLLVSFFGMIMYALFLGFVTDWVLVYLKKHVVDRKR